MTVRDLCDRYGVGEDSVLAWIRSGELKAMNVARSAKSKRPSWRISPEALAAFEAARTPEPPAPRAKRRAKHAGIVQFYQ